MEVKRHEHARAFLQEAVYRSRQRQASEAALPSGEVSVADGRCGLGEKAAVELDLSERGAELFEGLWPDGLEARALGQTREVMTAWIQRQDVLDRKRNHFLRDFREAHGYDRTAYSAEELQAYEDGLTAVNAEVDAGLTAASLQLLGPDQRNG